MDFIETHEFYESLKAIDKLRCNSFKGLSLPTPQCIIICICKTYQIKHNIKPKPSQISEELGVKPAAITPILNKLEDADLIEREFSKKDRREVFINLTEKGEAEFDIIHAHIRSYFSRMLNVIGEEDIKELIKISKKLESFNTQES